MPVTAAYWGYRCYWLRPSDPAAYPTASGAELLDSTPGEQPELTVCARFLVRQFLYSGEQWTGQVTTERKGSQSSLLIVLQTLLQLGGTGLLYSYTITPHVTHRRHLIGELWQVGPSYLSLLNNYFTQQLFCPKLTK